MNASTFSTGISVQWPRTERQQLVTASPFFADLPSAESAASTASPTSHHDTKRTSVSSSRRHDDEENYTGCQELAYQYAVEQTKSAVRAVLLKANSSCYHQVLRYFEKYMCASPLDTSGACVAFPELHGFPTAAVLAGTDATFSDVWVSPLCQVLQRSFPIVFVVREDFPNARRMIEWMAEQLDGVRRVRAREEDWLVAQIDGFDMLDTPMAAVQRAQSAAATAGRKQTLRTRSVRSTYAGLGAARAPLSSVSKDIESDSEGGDDDAFVAFEEDASDSSSDDDDEVEDQSWRRVGPGKRSRRPRTRRPAKAAKKASGASASAVDRPYSKWTMEQLLVRIQTNLDVPMGEHDPCAMWLATLHDLIHVKLDEVLETHAHDLARSIQSYNDAIDWLKTRIVMCRSLQSSHATVSTVSVRSTEYSLAQLLHAVLTRFVAYLDHASAFAAAAAFAPTESAPLEAEAPPPSESLARRWRQRIANVLQRHEDYYQLHHYSSSRENAADAFPRRSPFALVCIEQLEAFSQHVLDDFLVTWTNHVRQQQLSRPDASATATRLGFVVGVASAASPALRHINVSIASHLDVQFFALEDSRKCFDDILEALVVDANLPLCLSGDVLRWVAARHRTTQSITRFLHALAFVFFHHFAHTRWSFVSHFCLDAHYRKPLQSVQAPPKRLANWMRRLALRATSLHDYLLLFSDAKLHELEQLVVPSPATGPRSGDWLELLLQDVASLRHQRVRWGVGWKCFRAACSWLDVALQGDAFTAYLAEALDGKLANARKVHIVVQRLDTSSLHVVAALVDDWRAICAASARLSAASSDDDVAAKQSASALADTAAVLEELTLVCQYAMATAGQSATQRMVARLRDEVKSVFIERLVVAFVQPPRTHRTSARVLEWLVVRATAPLEARLHLNYYDQLKAMLLDLDDANGGHVDGTSWVNDVSLAFLYYQESAGIYLSLREWYESFAQALADELGRPSRRTKAASKRSDGAADEEDDPVTVETKARFLRAFCTLRHWGFVKSSLANGYTKQDSDTIEKVVFI